MMTYMSLWLAHPHLLLLLGAAGIGAGLLAGLMGIGGGVVLVPAMLNIYLAMGVDRAVAMPSALGTSLATIIFTAMISARAHHRRANIDFDVIRKWAPAVAVGAVMGVLIAVRARTEILTIGFSLFLLAVAVQLLIGPPQRDRLACLPPNPVRSLIGGGIGMVSAIMGIGGGTLTVPAMTLCGYPVKKAIGTASAMGFVIAVPGTISYIINGWHVAGIPPASLGFVNLVALMVITPFSMLAAPWGVRLVQILPVPRIKQIFSVFLVFTAVRLLLPLLGL